MHQLRGEPGVVKALQLLSLYRAKALQQLVTADKKRGVLQGKVQILDRLVKDITRGPQSFDKT